MAQFTLSSNTQAAIRTAISSPGTNNANYLAAYNDIYHDIVSNGQVNSGTVNWFAQAGEVNTQAFSPNAPGTFIWNYTIGAFAANGATVTTSELQTSSNDIGLSVFNRLLNNNFVFTDDVSAPNNFAPATIIAVDAGTGLSYLDSVTHTAANYAEWGGTLFAATELQDPDYAKTYGLNLNFGSSDCYTIARGFAQASAATGIFTATHPDQLGAAVAGLTQLDMSIVNNCSAGLFSNTILLAKNSDGSFTITQNSSNADLIEYVNNTGTTFNITDNSSSGAPVYNFDFGLGSAGISSATEIGYNTSTGSQNFTATATYSDGDQSNSLANINITGTDPSLTISGATINIGVGASLSLYGLNNSIYSAANSVAKITGVNNTDTVDDNNASIYDSNGTINIQPNVFLGDISGSNDYVDEEYGDRTGPRSTNDEVSIAGANNTVATASDVATIVNGLNNIINVNGSNSDVTSLDAATINIANNTTSNNIDASGSHISSSNSKFAVFGGSNTIGGNADGIYIAGTYDTIGASNSKVEFDSPSDYRYDDATISGRADTIGFGGYGSYGNYGGYGMSESAKSSGQNVGLIAAYDSETNDAGGALAAQTARLQAESSLAAGGSTSGFAAQFEGPRWAGKVVTWSLASGADSIGAQLSGVIGDQYAALIQSAFQTWAEASGIRFEEVSDSSSSDIRIGWSTFNSANSGVLGYTGFRAKDGSISPGATISLENPNDDALVTDANGQLAYSGTQTELYQLVLHEIGHTLGLADDSDPNSIEYGVLSSANRNLDATDLAGIQALYGTSSALPVPPASNALSPFSNQAAQLISSMAAFDPSSSGTTTRPASLAATSLAISLAPAAHF